MENKVDKNLFTVPQVVLLTKGPNFKNAITCLIKKIICLNNDICQKNLCSNCKKLQNNNFYDLKWVQLNENKYLKKQEASDIIEELSIKSLLKNNPKIQVIEQIEYFTPEASSVFLSMLENIRGNVYAIFTTNCLEKVLPTIRSRCQILSLNINEDNGSKEKNLCELIFKEFNFNFKEFNNEDFESLLNIVKEFIKNDNNKLFYNNFFLIKELVSYKHKSIAFFKLIFLLAKTKLFNWQFNQEISNNLFFHELLKSWQNSNNIFLVKLIEKITLLEKEFNSKTNFNLLFNKFFIEIYQDKNNNG